MLEPTSPLREVKDIDMCIKKVLRKKIDTMVGVSKVITQHPRFIYSINKKNIYKIWYSPNFRWGFCGTETSEKIFCCDYCNYDEVTPDLYL